jgi:hypothetical protein
MTPPKLEGMGILQQKEPNSTRLETTECGTGFDAVQPGPICAWAGDFPGAGDAAAGMFAGAGLAFAAVDCAGGYAPGNRRQHSDAAKLEAIREAFDRGGLSVKTYVQITARAYRVAFEQTKSGSRTHGFRRTERCHMWTSQSARCKPHGHRPTGGRGGLRADARRDAGPARP